MIQTVKQSVKKFSTLQRTIGRGKFPIGKKIKFIIEEGSSDKGKIVQVDNIINARYPFIQTFGYKAEIKSYSVRVGTGDKYWQQDADQFYAYLMTSSPETPLLFDGIPGEVSTFMGVVSDVVAPVTKSYGVSIISFTVVVAKMTDEPKLEYKKLFFDKIADKIQDQIDKADAAFQQAEKINAYINSIQNFFSKTQKLLSSGTQFVELASDVYSTLKNPLGSLGITNSIAIPLRGYHTATKALVNNITDFNFLSANSAGYYSMPFVRSKNANTSFSTSQTNTMRRLANVSALSFVEASVENTTKQSVSMEDLEAIRGVVINVIGTLMRWNDYYGDDTETANDLSVLLNYMNGLFSTLYTEATNKKTITVKADIIPVAFYFMQKGTRNGYDQFIEDNNLQSVMFIPKGTTVTLR